MNGKRTNSNWHKMDTANKFFISAWPIVFAAVVAQGMFSNSNSPYLLRIFHLSILVFKSFATFKVERGIKLRELEQLVGSTSFASAMKQPILLRRLDLLTLLLFTVWCLSPLGSQGLQRSFGTRPNSTDTTNLVSYLNMTGPNALFGPDSAVTGTDHNTKLQIALDYFMAAFLPTPRGVSVNPTDQDRYDNPTIPNINVLAPQTSDNKTIFDFDNYKSIKGNDSDYTDYNHTSAWGVPMKLPPMIYPGQPFDYGGSTKAYAQKLADELAAVDGIDFTMQTSFYNFTCQDWKTISWDELENLSSANQNAPWGLVGTNRFALTMTDSLNVNPNKTFNPSYRPNYLAAASLNQDGNTNFTNNEQNSTWQFSFMECTFDRVFIDVNVSCVRSYSNNYLPVCYNDDVSINHVQRGAQPQEPFFRDFSQDWTYGTDLVDSASVLTICKLFFNS
jgi:hypothetical protein